MHRKDAGFECPALFSPAAVAAWRGWVAHYIIGIGLVCLGFLVVDAPDDAFNLAQNSPGGWIEITRTSCISFSCSTLHINIHNVGQTHWIPYHGIKDQPSTYCCKQGLRASLALA